MKVHFASGGKLDLTSTQVTENPSREIFSAYRRQFNNKPGSALPWVFALIWAVSPLYQSGLLCRDRLMCRHSRHMSWRNTGCGHRWRGVASLQTCPLWAAAIALCQWWWSLLLRLGFWCASEFWAKRIANALMICPLPWPTAVAGITTCTLFSRGVVNASTWHRWYSGSFYTLGMYRRHIPFTSPAVCGQMFSRYLKILALGRTKAAVSMPAV